MNLFSFQLYLIEDSSPKIFSSVQLLSCVQLFATPRIAARQASLSITNSQSSRRLTSIKSVMPPSHLILCRPLFLLPPIPPSIRVFSSESTLRIRWHHKCNTISDCLEPFILWKSPTITGPWHYSHYSQFFCLTVILAMRSSQSWKTLVYAFFHGHFIMNIFAANEIKGFGIR